MAKRIERQLEVELTPEELTEYADDLAVKVRERGELDDERKEVAREYSDKLKVADGLIRRIALAVETGKEYRPVVCEWDYHHPEAGVKLLRRQDTGEIVEVSTMNEYDDEAYRAEMQLDIFDGQANADKEAKALADSVAKQLRAKGSDNN